MTTVIYRSRLAALLLALALLTPIGAAAAELPPSSNFDSGKVLKSSDLKALLQNVLDIKNTVSGLSSGGSGPNITSSGKIEIKSNGGTNKPTIIVADTNVPGVPVFNGYTQAGIGFLSNAQPGSSASPFFPNFINLGGPAGSWGVASGGAGSEGSTDIGIWSLADPVNGGSQGMVNFFNATGYNWNSISASRAGTRLGQIAAFGYAANGFLQTECGSINFYADESFSNFGPTPNDRPRENGGNTSAGTNTWFRNCRNGTGNERILGGFASAGTFAVGEWQHYGNSFTSGPGTITFKDNSEAVSPKGGAGILYSSGGMPFWVASAGAPGVHPVALQQGGVSGGNMAVWDGQGLIRDGGPPGGQQSDVRLKKNIRTLENPFPDLEALRGVRYEWKDSSKADIGLIAQEVEAVYPELVYTDANGMKMVNYAKLTPILLEAIKNLNDRVEALEER